MKTTTRSTFSAWLATMIACAALAAGCSSDGDSSPDTDPESADSSAVDEPIVETVVTVGKVTGDLGDAERVELKSAVKEVMDGFFEGAYLGDFPRSSFKEGYAVFTAGARRDAVRDADLMSNSAISTQIESASATGRRVILDVLAVKGAARGVTARFTLDFTTSGALEEDQRVKGYLLMVPQGKKWRVFGYDVIKGTVA